MHGVVADVVAGVVADVVTDEVVVHRVVAHQVVVHQEEPVSPPSHVAAYFAVARHIDFDVCGQAVARDIVHRDFTVRMQDGTHGSDGSLDAMLPGRDLFQKRKSSHQADGAVTTHTEITHVIKEDDAGSAGRIKRLAQERSHHDVGAPRLVDDSGSKTVVLG